MCNEKEVREEKKKKDENYCTRTWRACVGGAWDGADGWGIDCPAGDYMKCKYRR